MTNCIAKSQNDFFIFPMSTHGCLLQQVHKGKAIISLYSWWNTKKESVIILPIYIENDTYKRFYILMNLLTSLYNKMTNSTPLSYLKIYYL